MSEQEKHQEPQSNLAQTEPPHAAGFDQKEENAKAIRFMLIKAAIFILIPIVASVLAILFLL